MRTANPPVAQITRAKSRNSAKSDVGQSKRAKSIKSAKSVCTLFFDVDKSILFSSLHLTTFFHFTSSTFLHFTSPQINSLYFTSPHLAAIDRSVECKSKKGNRN
jgi:hypothetical protein